MYEWERDALGIDTLGRLQGGVRVQGRVRKASDDPSAWWVAALHAPEVWRVWRVGLLRRPVRLQLSEPLTLPDAAEFALSDDIPPDVRAEMLHLSAACVCPAVVAESALGFVVQCAGDAEAAREPRVTCDVYAPTGLRARLGLDVDVELSLLVLPAEAYHPHSRKQASRTD